MQVKKILFLVSALFSISTFASDRPSEKGRAKSLEDALDGIDMNALTRRCPFLAARIRGEFAERLKAEMYGGEFQVPSESVEKSEPTAAERLAAAGKKS